MTSFFDHFKKNKNDDKCFKNKRFIVHIQVNGNNHVCHDFSTTCENMQTPFDFMDAYIHLKVLVATLALGLGPRQGLAKVWAEKESPGITFHVLASVEECEEPTHSQVGSHFGNWNPNGFLNL